MDSFLGHVASGALTGLLFALIAMSFVIIYRAARVFNFAQGEIVVVGGFLVWTLMSSFDLPWWISVPMSGRFSCSHTSTWRVTAADEPSPSMMVRISWSSVMSSPSSTVAASATVGSTERMPSRAMPR